MPEPDLFQIFVGPLNLLGIRYMVTGAVASIVYGEVRLTHDIDLVMEVNTDEAEKIVRAFPLQEFYCPPVEVIRLEAGRSLRGHFNIIHHDTGFKADIYLMGQDDLHLWAMSNRRCIQMKENPLWIAPPEYVILRKLEYYREGGSEKHLRDISGMLEVSLDQLDMPRIEERVRSRGLEKEWAQAAKGIPNE
ncbi:MAG TPA: hypothetical protein ENH37_02200 [Deltaproteobacteria bacterium]|nr:hypothetical protein [Deltaproteobacteria bacterium]